MTRKLTDAAVRAAAPAPKKYTISAGKGLTLLVLPNGSKCWRLRYRFAGEARWQTLGKPYPQTTLKQAESEAQRIRDLVSQGVDPRDEKLQRKLALKQHVANTFGLAAEAWYLHRSRHWKEKTSRQVRQYLDRDIIPALGSRPLGSISTLELAQFVRTIEARGAVDVAKKMRQWLTAIFSFAKGNGWTKNVPTEDLAALTYGGTSSQNYPHLKRDELPAFLHALDADEGSFIVKSCAKLALMTGNRPGVTRTLKWEEVDFDNALWTIEKSRSGMKRGYRHLTPLPRQAIELLRSVQRISGSFEYVFVGRNDPSQPISDGAVAGLFKRIGYRGKQTMHGFRHLLSTALNEAGYQKDWIERQLAHGDPDKIRDTYNKAHYLEQRRSMMQDWADQLDELRRAAA